MPNIRQSDDGNQTEIWVETILSNRTKEGMVNFILKQGGVEIKTQWDIRKAREIHQMLGEAIEAAISDTMIFKFMRERVGLPEEKAVGVLADFREIRQGKREPSDWTN